LFFFDAGGGHRAAATALKSVIEDQQRGWDVRIENLQELLNSTDVVRVLTGIQAQDTYNLLLKKGWTLGMPEMLRVLLALVRLVRPLQVKLLEQRWRRSKPDLVVSLVPLFNRTVHRALSRAAPGTPFVTILTDLADYQPHFWIERQDQYFICGTERAAEQAVEIGNNPERVFRVSGMILRPQFYESHQLDRRTERAKLGLDPATPTGLVLFGGEGAPEMVSIARQLDGLAGELQLIFLCGRNQKLAARLRKLETTTRIHVEEFTTNVPYFMRLADFFIGKPGPGSISEAIRMNLPVIVELNRRTMPQERYNARWIRENEVGIVVPNTRSIGEAVRTLLDGENLKRHRAAAARMENGAVFEIPEILAGLLKGDLGKPGSRTSDAPTMDLS